jgi:hypothetical protein
MSRQGTYNNLDYHCKVLIADLKKIAQEAPDIWRVIVSLPPPIITRPVLNKFGWWALPGNVNEFNIAKLVLFHYVLKQHGYVVCSYEEFEQHFIDDKKPSGNKIEWSGDVMILVLLFDVLMNDKKIIPPISALYDTLCEHFVWLDKNNNSLKKLSKGSLKSSLSNARKNNAVQDIVKNICALLLS